MCRWYRETKYCVYIRYGEGKFFNFARHSLMDSNHDYVPCHVSIENQQVYDIFFMLFPILKTMPRDLIHISKSWESWHGLNDGEQMPINIYNEEYDKFLTGYFERFKKENI